MMVQGSEGDEGLSDQDRGGCGKRGGAEVNRPHDHANVLYVFRASRMIKKEFRGEMLGDHGERFRKKGNTLFLMVV